MHLFAQQFTESIINKKDTVIENNQWQSSVMWSGLTLELFIFPITQQRMLKDFIIILSRAICLDKTALCILLYYLYIIKQHSTNK